VKAAFERWLSPDNFDAQGAQRLPRAEIRSRLVREIPAEMAA
jgi:hypothetical protein